MYPAGTIVTHQFEVRPSEFRRGETYATDGEWYVGTKENMPNVRAPQFLEALVKWCATSQRTDDKHEEWVQALGLDKDEDN